MMMKVNMMKLETESDPALGSSSRKLTKYDEVCLGKLPHAAFICAEVSNSFFYEGNIKTGSI